MSAGFVPRSLATSRAFSHGGVPRFVTHCETRPELTPTSAAKDSCVQSEAVSSCFSNADA